jgi:ribulose-bisphosphate carboxylase large chain
MEPRRAVAFTGVASFDQPTPVRPDVTAKLQAVYRIRCDAARIEERARTIAVEQSVEMPVEAIDDQGVLADIVGQVVSIADRRDGTFDATIALDVEATGFEAGQLINMLFGNSSIHDDVTLAAITVPPSLSAAFCGPRHGPAGLRARVGAGRRALTCSALKPLGLSPDQLAHVAHALALGGLDFIKDDHGLADQRRAPFATRVAAVAAAVRSACASTGRATRYLPNVSGNLDQLRAQVNIARDHGLDTLLIAPMVVGLPSFTTIVRENADMAFIAHPAMAGAARIAPEALLGTLFRMLGADAVIYPNAGGRFGYTPAQCRAIAATALAPWPAIAPSLPVPAGGMKLARISEILACTGPDAMLLIGGDLLSARDKMTTEAARFQLAIEGFVYRQPATLETTS